MRSACYRQYSALRSLPRPENRKLVGRAHVAKDSCMQAYATEKAVLDDSTCSTVPVVTGPAGSYLRFPDCAYSRELPTPRLLEATHNTSAPPATRSNPSADFIRNQSRSRLTQPALSKTDRSTAGFPETCCIPKHRLINGYRQTYTLFCIIFLWKILTSSIHLTTFLPSAGVGFLE